MKSKIIYLLEKNKLLSYNNLCCHEIISIECSYGSERKRIKSNKSFNKLLNNHRSFSF